MHAATFEQYKPLLLYKPFVSRYYWITTAHAGTTWPTLWTAGYFV